MPIHPTAQVHPRAELENSADIGPYCVVGPQVKIGANSRLVSHVYVDGRTTIGSGNTLYPFCSVGTAPQDLKYRGEPSELIIGDNNIIRESATVNTGTEGGHMKTVIGSECLLMAHAHVAHDCILGDGVVLANSVGLAGHVELQEHVTVGGIAGIHQHCRVGRYAFVAAGAMVARDVPPFCMAQGDRAQLVGINVVALRRAGWSRERVHNVRQAFKQLFQSAHTRLVSLENTEEAMSQDPDVMALCAFVRASGRGVCSPRVAGGSADPFEGCAPEGVAA